MHNIYLAQILDGIANPMKPGRSYHWAVRSRQLLASHPYPAKIRMFLVVENCSFDDEKMIHNMMSKYSIKGEYNSMKPSLAIKTVRAFARKYGKVCRYPTAMEMLFQR